MNRNNGAVSQVALALALAFLTGCGLVDAISRADAPSPQTMTWSNFYCYWRDIQSYADQHHALPANFSDIPPTSKRVDRTDGWDQPVAYAPQPDGSVALRSAGEGGKAPYVYRFSIVDHNIPREDIAVEDTFGNMQLLEIHIRHYAAEHGRLPGGYSDLPLKGYRECDCIEDRFVDSWGHPISYTPRSDGTALLASHGAAGNQIFSVEFTVPGVKAKTD